MRNRHGHANFPGQGRPPGPRIYSGPGEEHVGDVITPRLRAWVDGEIFIEDTDDEGKLLLAKLKPMLEELSNRRDATGRPFPNSAFAVRTQPVPTEGVMPRRQGPTMKPKKRPIDEVCLWVETYPGSTLDQLVRDFYGADLSPVDLPRARSSMTTTLYRAMAKGGVNRKYDEHGVVHYYPPGDVNMSVKVDERVRTIAAAMAFAREGKTDVDTIRSHYLEAQAVADLVDHNRDRPPEAWRSPPRDGEERPF